MSLSDLLYLCSSLPAFLHLCLLFSLIAAHQFSILYLLSQLVSNPLHSSCLCSTPFNSVRLCSFLSVSVHLLPTQFLSPLSVSLCPLSSSFISNSLLLSRLKSVRLHLSISVCICLYPSLFVLFLLPIPTNIFQ